MILLIAIVWLAMGSLTVICVAYIDKVTNDTKDDLFNALSFVAWPIVLLAIVFIVIANYAILPFLDLVSKFTNKIYDLVKKD